MTKKGDDRRNLSLERLVNAVKGNNATFGAELGKDEWDAVKKCRDGDFEEIRSERIAPNDFLKMTARFNGQPVGWPSREQVERFLTLCTKVMDKVHEYYIGCPFLFNFNAHDGMRAGETVVKVLEEFSKRHVADVEVGKATWIIRPPKGWPNLPPIGLSSAPMGIESVMRASSG